MYDIPQKDTVRGEKVDVSSTDSKYVIMYGVLCLKLSPIDCFNVDFLK